MAGRRRAPGAPRGLLCAGGACMRRHRRVLPLCVSLLACSVLTAAQPQFYGFDGVRYTADCASSFAAPPSATADARSVEELELQVCCDTLRQTMDNLGDDAPLGVR